MLLIFFSQFLFFSVADLHGVKSGLLPGLEFIQFVVVVVLVMIVLRLIAILGALIVVI